VSNTADLRPEEPGTLVAEASQAYGDPVFEVKAPAIEVAVATLLRDTKNFVDALKRMTMNADERTRLSMQQVPNELTSDHADATVRLILQRTRETLELCGTVPESQTRLLVARQMTQSFYDGLKRIKLDRDSVPGIRLAKVYLACCHTVLDGRKLDAQRNEAVSLWREHSRRILARV